MLLTRTDGAILQANAAATELFGWSEAEILERGRDGLVVHDADLEKALEGRARHGKFQAELNYRRADGTTFIGETTSTIFGHDGAWQLSSLIVRDVSERRRLDREHRESEARLAYVLDGSNDGFWDWDIPSGRVQYSRRWAAMLGYDLAELKPDLSTWQQLVHPDEMAGISAALEAHLSGKTDHYECEHRLRAKDGSWVWVLDRGKVVERGPDGAPIRAAGTHTDITARKKAEDALRTALAENERLVVELREALAHVKTLAGFLPICMHCKKIRDDHGYWERIDKYISEHTDARFSHGICPECAAKHYPELKRSPI